MSQSDQTQNPQDNPNQGTQEQKPLFSVGERQYDVDSAKKKIANADSHINTLETENSTLKDRLAALEAKLDQSTKLDEALAKLQGNQMQQPATPTETPTPVDVEALKADLLRQAQEAATNSVSAYKQQEIAQNNLADSIGAAQRFHGSEYEAKLREEGAALGLDDEAINSMAQSNPALFKKTFGLTGSPKPQLNPDGSVNTTGLHQVKTPEFKDLGKQWGTSAKVAALHHNEAQIKAVLESVGGDMAKAAQVLGIKL